MVKLLTAISDSMAVSPDCVAFVLGGANTLVDDYARARAFVHPHTIIATNEAGRDYKGVLPHWVTLHTEKIETWHAERLEAGHGRVENFWTSNKEAPEYMNFRRVQSWDGSSGLLAVTVALSLGYNKVILCGVPLDKKACHYFDTKPWMDAPRYRHAWIAHRAEMEGKVKSMSGWTKLTLGEPDLEWINKDGYK